MRLTDLLALSHVPRWSIVPHSRPQSVADHTFRMMVIAAELFERIGVEMTCDTMLYILRHDGAESRSADISAPFKRTLNESDLRRAEFDACPWIDEFESMGPDRDVARLVIICDLLEAYTYIVKYGVGSHASRVAEKLAVSIKDRCNWSVTPWSVIEKLIHDIVDETGR